MIPDDSDKELSTVLSYLTGRTLSKEEIWVAMELPRSTYYDQVEKGTLINADNLRKAAANLGINRVELLARYRLIDPAEIFTLTEALRGQAVSVDDAPRAQAKPRTKRGSGAGPSVSALRQRSDSPPL